MKECLRWTVLLLLCTATGAKDYFSKNFECSADDMRAEWMDRTTLLVNCMQADLQTQGREGAVWQSEDAGGEWARLELTGLCDNPDMCVFDFAKEDTQHGYLITTKGGLVWDRKKSSVVHSLSNGRPLYLISIIPHPSVASNGRVLGLHLLPEVGCTERRDCPYLLYYSTDFGKSFKLILNGQPVWQVSWGTPRGEYFDADEIFFIVKKGKATKMWQPKDWNWIETYNLRTEVQKKVIHDALYFVNVGRYTYYLIEGKVRKELHMSSTNGRVLVKTEFPSDRAQMSWRIILSNDGAAFVAVYHEDCNRNEYVVSWGTLYQSDATGEDFVISLDNIRWGLETRQPDFHAAGGINGVYIANSVLVDEEQCKACDSQESCIADCRYVTRISFSNGDPGTWEEILAPEGLRAECKNQADCFLHLHNYASPQKFIPGLQSRPNSPGVIMGVGNVGGSLDVTGVDSSLFMTIDGGEKWRRVAKGSWAYDWSNYGGMIVIVETNTPTKSFKYSLDMGRTFDGPVSFTDMEDIMVYKVEAAGGAWSDGKSPVFNLHSYNTQTNTVVVWKLDLTQFKGEPCAQPGKGEVAKGNDPNFWLFKRDTVCFMGAEIAYVQKREGSKCWNMADEIEVEESSLLKRCDCTLEDYECDHGFKRIDGRCESEVTKGEVFDLNKLAFVTEKDHHPPVECQEAYFRKTGYVLRPGHKCNKKALMLSPVLTQCPGGKKGGWFGTFVLVIFILIVCGVMGVYLGAFMGNTTAYGLKLLLEEKLEAVTNPLTEYVAVRRTDPDVRVDADPVVMESGSEFEDNDEYSGGPGRRADRGDVEEPPQTDTPPDPAASSQFSPIPLHTEEDEQLETADPPGNPFLDFQPPPSQDQGGVTEPLPDTHLSLERE